MRSPKHLYCSFCGKNNEEVRKLIAGPSVFICDECVELCNDIVRDCKHGPREMVAGDIGLRLIIAPQPKSTTPIEQQAA